MADKKMGVLLANLGSPAAPTVPAVRKFLKDFLGDKRVVNIPRFVWLPILHGFILPFRPKKSLKAYAKIWDAEKGSPLTFLTHQLTSKLATKLASRRIGNSTASTEVSHLKPLSPAPFFTLSALTERLPRSSDPIVNQKSALCGPIHNLKIHRHKPAQGESKTLTQLYPFTL